jgi:integrase
VTKGRARARGEGTIYQRNSDGRWVAALRWPTGQRKRRYARTQKDALRQLEELKSELRAGHPPPDDRLNVGAWLDRWLEQRVSKLTYNTKTSYEQVVRDYIRPGLGRQRLLPMKVADVEAWMEDLIEQGVPLPTVKYSLIVLRIALKAAMRADILNRNPAALVEPPVYRKRKGKPLTKGEAMSLLTVIRQHRLFALIVLALTTALRRGEMLGVQWQDIRADEGYLSVQRQLQRQTGAGIVEVPVKTERSEAPVALTGMFLRALQVHRSRLIEERMAAGPTWRGSDNPVAPGAFVFVSEKGTTMDGDNVWRSWKKMLADAEIEARRLHDSRHTTATILDALGVPPEVIQSILRHSRLATTMGVYVHSDLSRQREAVAQLDDLLGNVLG